MNNNSSRGQNGLSVLRRFVRPRRTDVEYCDLCNAVLAPEHQHLLEPQSRQIICSCDACTILFSDISAKLKYWRIPQRVRSLPEFQLTEMQWESLFIPVGMAFFFNNSIAGKVMVMYPSPAGPTESLLSLESWTEIVQANPILEKMQPDVEALLVNRVSGAREYYIAPIDKCYELVGLIRTYWHGLSGGTEMWEVIATFYAKLNAMAIPVGENPHA
jgi:hypothetical protein